MMNLPPPKNYTEKVLYAITNAIIEASTDREAKTVTYRTGEVAEACVAAAAIMLNAHVPGITRPSVEAIESQIAAAFRKHLTFLHETVPNHTLEAEIPGFKAITLA